MPSVSTGICICKFLSVAYISIAQLAVVRKLHNAEMTISLAYEALSSTRRTEDDLCLSGWVRWIRSACRVITANFLITSAPSISVAFIKSHNCIGLTCSFYPLWVLFWWFSSELVAPPLPVWVDKGWLKPGCGEYIEHMSACVYCCVLFVLSKQSCVATLTWKEYLNTIRKTLYRSCEQMVLYLLLQTMQTNKKPCKKQSSPQLLRYIKATLRLLLLHFNFLCVFVLFLPVSMVPSPCLYLSFSCIDSDLLCLRELASKLSAASASGLKAISSASLPLQVHAWDW